MITSGELLVAPIHIVEKKVDTKVKKKVVEDLVEEEVNPMEALDKIAKHLVFLEKKLDTLIEQTKGRSESQGNRYSRPFKPRTFSGRSDNYNQEHRPNRQPSYNQDRGGNDRYSSHNQDRGPDRYSKGNSRGNSRNKKRGFRPGQSNR